MWICVPGLWYSWAQQAARFAVRRTPGRVALGAGIFDETHPTGVRVSLACEQG
jgi:hypothetical protein